MLENSEHLSCRVLGATRWLGRPGRGRHTGRPLTALRGVWLSSGSAGLGHGVHWGRGEHAGSGPAPPGGGCMARSPSRLEARAAARSRLGVGSGAGQARGEAGQDGRRPLPLCSAERGLCPWVVGQARGCSGSFIGFQRRLLVQVPRRTLGLHAGLSTPARAAREGRGVPLSGRLVISVSEPSLEDPVALRGPAPSTGSPPEYGKQVRTRAGHPPPRLSSGPRQDPWTGGDDQTLTLRPHWLSPPHEAQSAGTSQSPHRAPSCAVTPPLGHAPSHWRASGCLRRDRDARCRPQGRPGLCATVGVAPSRTEGAGCPAAAPGASSPGPASRRGCVQRLRGSHPRAGAPRSPLRSSRLSEAVPHGKDPVGYSHS